MQTTPILGVSYPEPTDHTRLWEYFEALALADDAQEKRPCWRGSFVTGTGTNIASGNWYVPLWTDSFLVGMTRVGRAISATRAGIYRATATMSWGINTTGIRRVQINLNPVNNETADGGVGGTTLIDQVQPTGTSAAFGTAVTATVTVKLAVGDRLTAQGYQNSGATLSLGINGAVGTFFSVEYLGVDDD